MQRNTIIDVLKGYGMVLMILGHCLLPFKLNNFIFIFHMPLFFLISGYLFKDRNIPDLANKVLKRIILPYVVTGVIIWVVKAIGGQWNWGLSLLLGNGSRPVFDSPYLRSFHIGPLWYLIAFSWATVLFHFVLKIRSNWYKGLLLFTLFEFSVLLCTSIGILPFDFSIGPLPLDLFQAFPATLFLLAGYIYKEHRIFIDKIFRQKLFHFISIGVVIICFKYGSLSMASHYYRLNVFQIWAALYMVYVSYLVIRGIHKRNMFTHNKLWGGVQIVGQFSLPILCFHSIDNNLRISNQLASALCPNEQLQFLFVFVISLFFAIGLTFFAYHIPFLSQLFSMKK